MKYNNPLFEFAASIRRVGLVPSILLAYSRAYDLVFDRMHGIDTAARLELDELTITEQTVSKGQMYQPTGVLAFRRVMDELSLPKNPVLIDYGSGKGRTLALAAMLPDMKKVIGVEFSSELVETADRNARILERQGKLVCPIENICVDATKYQYSDIENVFYFFYPFDAQLMQIVVGQILESVARNPRPAKMVYYYPVHENALQEFPQLVLERRFQVYGYPCLIFHIKS